MRKFVALAALGVVWGMVGSVEPASAAPLSLEGSVNLALIAA